MGNSSKQTLPDTVKSSALETLSIKKLTLLGFSLVALPLVIALLYSATQMNQLSNESKDAIFNAAALTETNRSLSETLVKMERNASQSIVLNDPELLSNYFVEEKRVINIVNDQLRKNTDQSLRDIIEKFLGEVEQTHNMLSNTSKETLYLTKIQDQFKQLAKTSQEINNKSNQLIFTQAVDVRTSARIVRQTMLKSLLIIPLTVLIAIFFIIRITKPLKKLIKQIQILEKGSFEHAINFRSSPEINEIIDALEVMRTRLHALELQKSSFIRHISHELKTPLTAIREGTELLYDNTAGPLNKNQQEIIDITRGGVTRLQQLIEDLLDFNIVLDSTSLQDSEKLDVPYIINEALLERKLDIKRKNLSVDLNCDSVFIFSNGKQLAVILDNLLSNAIKYSPTNGTISITATLQAEHLLLSLSDQGDGVEEHVLENMFEAFYQGPAPEGSVIKSSGLGLTIVKELLMRINGTIDVKSSTESPTGTRFNLVLPRAFKKGKNHE